MEQLCGYVQHGIMSVSVDFMGSIAGITPYKLYKLDKLLNFFVPQFFHLSNRVDDNILTPEGCSEDSWINTCKLFRAVLGT